MATRAQIRAARKNIKKAQAARRRMMKGGKKYMKKVKRRMMKGGKKYKRQRGGFLPAVSLVPLSIHNAHKTLQSVKPLTFAKNVADAVGLSKPITNLVNRLGPVGNLLKSAFKFGREQLGYARHRLGFVRGHQKRLMSGGKMRRIRVKGYLRRV